MDMKKKLEDTYNPEQHAQKERIVVGLNGSIDSMVAAFLLKIQKYELLAVTVMNSWDTLKTDQASVLSCHITHPKIERIKDFCHKLNIPLHIVNSNAEFNEEVASPWISDKVLGKFPKPCWSCHEVRMHLLHHKMLELGAKQIVTGHYAKLFRHDSKGTVFVHTSNDEEHDQSELLVRLPHDVLASLYLPLSDLTKKEVLKLAENFGLTYEADPTENRPCFEWGPDLAAIVTKEVPARFIKPGDIMNKDESIRIGDHPGVQHYKLGQTIEYRENGAQVSGIFGEYVFAEKKIKVAQEEHYLRNQFMLVKCHLSEEVSWVEPFKGSVQLRKGEFVDCWVYPKSLSSIYIELLEPRKILPGEVVTVLKRRGKNSKIYLSGEIQFIEKNEDDEEGVSHVPKANYSGDF